MSDIVEQLRQSAAASSLPTVPAIATLGVMRRIPADLVLEAADEIERLRAELAKWEAAAPGFVVASR